MTICRKTLTRWAIPTIVYILHYVCYISINAYSLYDWRTRCWSRTGVITRKPPIALINSGSLRLRYSCTHNPSFESLTQRLLIYNENVKFIRLCISAYRSFLRKSIHKVCRALRISRILRTFLYNLLRWIWTRCREAFSSVSKLTVVSKFFNRIICLYASIYLSVFLVIIWMRCTWRKNYSFIEHWTYSWLRTPHQ